MIENRTVMARNIMRQMQKKGVNATEVCNALGFKQNTFSDWVHGKTYPRIDAIEKMANYFNIPKAFLVEDICEVDIFSDDERKLIVEYRNADGETQRMVRRLLAYTEKIKEMHDDNR